MITINIKEIEDLFCAMFTDEKERRLKIVGGNVVLQPILFSTDKTIIKMYESNITEVENELDRRKKVLSLMKIAAVMDAEIMEEDS